MIQLLYGTELSEQDVLIVICQRITQMMKNVFLIIRNFILVSRYGAISRQWRVDVTTFLTSRIYWKFNKHEIELSPRIMPVIPGLRSNAVTGWRCYRSKRASKKHSMKGLMHDSAGAIEEKTSYEVAFLQHAITEELSDKRDSSLRV